jgi:hypothetical protein
VTLRTLIHRFLFRNAPSHVAAPVFAPLARCACGTLFAPRDGAERCTVCAGDACPRCGRATKERECPRPACKRLATIEAKAGRVVRMAERGRR